MRDLFKLDRTALTDAVVFWETGRLAYNGALAALVLGFAIVGDAWAPISRAVGSIVILGAIANTLYCAAYPVDLVAQATPLRHAWRRYRWVLWLLGTLASAFLATLFVVGFAGISFRPD